jgi:hypothetical protein
MSPAGLSWPLLKVARSRGPGRVLYRFITYGGLHIISLFQYNIFWLLFWVFISIGLNPNIFTLLIYKKSQESVPKENSFTCFMIMRRKHIYVLLLTTALPCLASNADHTFPHDQIKLRVYDGLTKHT